MTELLEKAFAEAAKLPAEAQDALAEWILEELAAEKRWQKAFANAEDMLALLADDALAEFYAGETDSLLN
jgi:hypothetical protein